MPWASMAIHEDEHTNGNGGVAVNDDDIRAMLAAEKKARAELKAELEAERTGRTRAEASATTHQSARFEAEEQAVQARIAGADSEAAGLRKAYAEALSEGRYDDAADVQDKMGALRAKQQSDQSYRAWLATEKTRLQQQPAQPQQEGVDLSQYSAAQRRWIKSNPDFMDDPKVRAKTFAGHQLAVAEGIEVDTPEYFEIIDSVVNRSKAAPKKAAREEADEEDESPFSDTGKEPAPSQRSAAPPEVPVSRRQPAATEKRERAIKLTPEEREAADITLPDYPIEGKKDRDGNYQPGRYERYVTQRQRLRERGN